MMPVVPERRTHSYVRHGTTSLLAALDIASGFVIDKCYKRHQAAEFLDFLKQIDAKIPDGLDVHIYKRRKQISLITCAVLLSQARTSAKIAGPRRVAP